jgi:cytochrome c553
MLTGKPIIAVTIGLLVLMSAAGNVQAKGNVERGGDLASDCIGCHGMDGEGNFETPPVAGLNEAYLLKQLRAFYGDERKSLDDMMHLYTEERTDQDLQDLAAFWASKPK